MWAGLPGDPATGGLYEIYYTMKKAIGAARKYIYIEDQYLDDQPHLDGVKDPSYSLFPELLKALNATANFDLRLIFVGSGHKDPGDPGPALKNQSLTSSIQKVVDGLLPLRKTNVAVWRRDLKTVHSKVMIIDDEFVSLGSANFQSRSMAGIDSELQAAVVAQDDLVKDLRILLWAEHFKLNPSMSGVGAGLNSIDSALALWRKDWYSDTAYWDNLTGHNPAAGYGGLISFVGPGVVP